MKLHHIGIATEDIENLVEYLKQILNIKDISETVYDKNQDANLCMLTLEDGTKLELVSGKVVEKIVKKRQFLYHTCYETENIEEEIEKLKKLDSFLVSEPKEAILIGVVFGVLFAIIIPAITATSHKDNSKFSKLK